MIQTMLFLLFCATPARAEVAPLPAAPPTGGEIQPAPPAQTQEKKPQNAPIGEANGSTSGPSIYKWSDTHKNCQEWTDNCVVCRQIDAQNSVCSTPGIACTPSDIICNRP